MPFCPECAFEYNDDIAVCPECKIALADRPPGRIGAAVRPDTSWVKICRLDNRFVRDMVKGLLNANNIPSMFISQALQPLGTGIGWFSDPKVASDNMEIVLVPREFQDEAEVLLGAVLGEDIDLFDNKPGL